MLSPILTNKSVWKILILYSYGEGAGYTWSDLKKHSNLQNKSLKIATEILLFNKILKKEKKIFKMNFGNENTSFILEIIKKEKEKLNFPSFELYLALIVMVEKIQKREEIDEIYLFGSHAKKKASKNSDIDIAIITKDINLDFTKEKIELEENFGYKFEFHTHNFGKDFLSTEIKTHGVKII